MLVILLSLCPIVALSTFLNAQLSANSMFFSTPTKISFRKALDRTFLLICVSLVLSTQFWAYIQISLLNNVI